MVISACKPEKKSSPQAIVDAYKRPASQWPKAQIDSGVAFTPLAPLPEVSHPKENPYSRSKKLLGKQLFFDPRLSASGSIACASCHDPELGWADGRKASFGHKRRQGSRNAMSILNVAFYHQLFWDGRVGSLEEQVRFPIEDPNEMNMKLSVVPYRIDSLKAYLSAFEQAFGSPEITEERIAKALATFEREIVSRKSAFDRFYAGDTSAMTDQQIMGLHLFRTKARCINCHNGPLFSDNEFHNIGQSHLGRPSEDLGLYNVTADTADVGKFRTPSLRDVIFTGPYMHHGLMFEITEVIDMYDRGMPQIIPRRYDDHPLKPKKDRLLRPLNLKPEEKKALLAFLEAISLRPRRIDPPELP